MKKIIFPGWVNALPDDACLSSEEVAKIYGYSGVGSLGHAMDGGLIPRPDRKVRSSKGGMKYLNKWSVGCLREANNQ